jgi:hypothetical protein
MSRTIRCLLLVFTPWMVLTRTSEAALVINGGFEQAPALTGWSSSGETGIATIATFGIAPAEGLNQAVTSLEDPGQLSTPSDIESFLGLSSGSLQSLVPPTETPIPDVIAGSAIKQSLSVTAGEILTFNWNFITDDVTGAGQTSAPDFAFWSLRPELSNPVALANLTTGTFFATGSTDYPNGTGYQTASYTFTTSGIFTIGFGVMSVGDLTGKSALLIDNVKIGPLSTVPEPFTAGAVGLALAISAAGSRLRRRLRATK